MMPISRRQIIATLSLLPFAAAAQNDAIGGTVTLVVPFPAGGSVDAVARQVQRGLQERLQANVIIDNRGGAAGSLGAGQVARAAPDGRTWLLVFDSHAVNPFLQKLTFDTQKDLLPVMLIGTAPNVLAVHPTREFKSFPQMIAAAKAKPGALTYASIGAGSLGHLTMVRLGKQLGIELSHVPYRGGGPAMNDAIAGHVDMIIGSAALINPQLVSQTLHPLVQFGPKRATSPQLAQVPTAAESGAPGLESSAWWGVFAPANTPKPIMERFERDMRATLAEARVRENLTQSQQIDIKADGPQAFERFFENEMRVWGNIVRENNIQLSSQ
jgi:tripartite-type tricarboxylate transporter receptor subunit TctC